MEIVDEDEKSQSSTISNRTFTLSPDHFKKKPAENVFLELHEDIHHLDNNKDKEYLEISVHKVDRIQFTSLVPHPLVKVTILNRETGDLYDGDTKIQPIMTHPCILQDKRLLYPIWNESLHFDQIPIDRFKSDLMNIIVLFEIVDFVPLSLLNQVRKYRTGWHYIAFAFLKPNDIESVLGKRLKLQLYQIRTFRELDLNQCPGFKCWKKGKLHIYPSGLYVTLGSCQNVIDTTDITAKPIEDQEVNDQPLETGFIKEFGTLIRDNLMDLNQNGMCQLPNYICGRISTGPMGCLTLKFSNNGLFLAASIRTDDLYDILVYSVESLQESYRLVYHQSLIYTIIWSRDDQLLICGSADKTVSIWNTNRRCLIQVLPHPAFVYCVKLVTDSTTDTIITGSYNKIIQIWTRTASSNDFKQQQELRKHTGYVTTLSYSRRRHFLLSGDSNGDVIEWKNVENMWKFTQQLILNELHTIQIDQIELVQKDKCFLVLSRDNYIRFVHRKSLTVLHKFSGALCRKFTLTTCETYLICGSGCDTTGLVYYWNLKTGKTVGTLTPYGSNCQINCLDFNCRRHLLAVSHYGGNLPIILLTYNENDTNTIEFIKRKKIHVEDDRTAVNLQDLLEKMDRIIDYPED